MLHRHDYMGVCDNKKILSLCVCVCVCVPEVGFEPTHPKITELKSAALDHSAIQALNTLISDSRGIRTPAGKAHQISNLAP